MDQRRADEVSEERAKRFYDRLRDSIHEFARNRGVIGKTAEYLMLVPDMFMLLWRLTTDSRVSGKNKVLLGSGVAYFVLPFDLIPEAIVGPIGYLDDLVFAVYVLSRVLNDTDPAILREHWSGEGDVLDKIRKVLSAADTLVATNVSTRLKKMLNRS
ncbi:MAG TPA: DUF1232 domain-containing protein [Thermoanaerobaculia bacterium]|nr:DUF1232 domain-containing protein [Thermoanaerobaculia bacterium]